MLGDEEVACLLAGDVGGQGCTLVYAHVEACERPQEGAQFDHARDVIVGVILRCISAASVVCSETSSGRTSTSTVSPSRSAVVAGTRSQARFHQA